MSIAKPARATDTVDAMARHAADFVGALSMAEVDLLGFSLGGYVRLAASVDLP
jgi:hypothetical protein